MLRRVLFTSFLTMLVWSGIGETILFTDDKDPEIYRGIWIKNLAANPYHNEIMTAIGTLETKYKSLTIFQNQGMLLSLYNDFVFLPDLKGMRETAKLAGEISDFIEAIDDELIWMETLHVPLSQADQYLKFQPLTVKPASGAFPAGEKDYAAILVELPLRLELFDPLLEILYSKKRLNERISNQTGSLERTVKDKKLLEGVKNIAGMLDAFNVSYTLMADIFADGTKSCKLKSLLSTEIRMSILKRNFILRDSWQRAIESGVYHGSDVLISLHEFQSMISAVSAAEWDDSMTFAQRYLALLNLVFSMSDAIPDMEKKIPDLYGNSVVFKITNISQTASGDSTSLSAEWQIARVIPQFGSYRILIPTRTGLEQFRVEASSLEKRYGDIDSLLTDIKAQIAQSEKELESLIAREKKARTKLDISTDGWQGEHIEQIVQCMKNLLAYSAFSPGFYENFFLTVCVFRKDLGLALGIPEAITRRAESWYAARLESTASPLLVGGAMVGRDDASGKRAVIYDDPSLVLGAATYVANNGRQWHLYADKGLTLKLRVVSAYTIVKAIFSPTQEKSVQVIIHDGQLYSGWMDPAALAATFAPQNALVKPPHTEAKVRLTPPTDLLLNNFAAIAQIDTVPQGSKAVILQEFHFMWNGSREGWYFIEYEKDGKKQRGWTWDGYYLITGEN